MKFAIMGTGVMGCGWITQCAISGHDVHCYDSNPDSVAAVAQQCEKLAGYEKGSLSGTQHTGFLGQPAFVSANAGRHPPA